MYRYKLNNSYTVYINYYYINECRKASKKTREELKEKVTPYRHSVPIDRTHIKTHTKPEVTPLPNNTIVKHAYFGIGMIVENNVSGYVTVNFNGRNIKFQYPQAFHLGHLSCAAV